MPLFIATKTMAQDLPSILWLTCCSLCWSLLPPSLQVFPQLKTWDQLRLPRLLQATHSVNPSLKTTGWVNSWPKSRVIHCLHSLTSTVQTVNNSICYAIHNRNIHLYCYAEDSQLLQLPHQFQFSLIKTQQLVLISRVCGLQLFVILNKKMYVKLC